MRLAVDCLLRVAGWRCGCEWLVDRAYLALLCGVGACIVVVGWLSRVVGCLLLDDDCWLFVVYGLLCIVRIRVSAVYVCGLVVGCWSLIDDC